MVLIDDTTLSLDTDQFSSAGQNIAGIGVSNGFPSKNDGIYSVILTFYNQKSSSNSSNICKVSISNLFTQLVWANATDVGCGATQYYDNGYYWFIMTCNYASSSKNGMTAYFEGSPGSGCSTGINPQFPGLCSINEPLNPNYSYNPGNSCTAASSGITPTGTNFCNYNCGPTKNIGCNATNVRFLRSNKVDAVKKFRKN